MQVQIVAALTLKSAPYVRPSIKAQLDQRCETAFPRSEISLAQVVSIQGLWLAIDV